MKQQLLQITEELAFIRVETALIVGAIVLLIGGLVTQRGSVLKSLFALPLLFALYFSSSTSLEGPILSDALFLTDLSQTFTWLFMIAGLGMLLFPRDQQHATEFYFFILSILIGSLFLMKSNSLLVMYLAIELTSFASYLITNFSFSPKGHEAGIKYLLFGALSSAFMLLGLGMIYGATGTLFVSSWDSSLFITPIAQVGLLLTVFGLFFKASIFPFHIWVPATYQNAPADATAFLSIVPKLAALVLIQRIFGTMEVAEWVRNFTLTLGILTMLFGTLAAFRQQHARRMISFGAIANSGLLLPFALMDTPTSTEAFVWYATVYAVMNLGVFYLLDWYERHEIVAVDDYSKIGGKAGVPEVAIVAVLASLVGLPPVAGFTAKFFLFTALWEYYLLSQETIYLIYLLFGLLVTVLALFFYFKIPYRLFLVKTVDYQSITTPFSTKIIATLFTIVLLLLFFVPQLLTLMQQLLNNLP